MSEIRHIVWDWNGTLLADTALTVKAATAAFEAIGRPVEITVERWRQIVTRPIRITYETLAGGPLDPPVWKELTDVWLEAYIAGLPSVGLNPLTLAALDEADRRGMTQSIVSLHFQSELRADVAAQGIADRFVDISGTPEYTDGKDGSKAERVLAQLAAIGVDPAQALMIGDMEDDGNEGRRAGASAILVTTGDTSRERLLAGAYPVADSILDAVRGITLPR